MSTKQDIPNTHDLIELKSMPANLPKRETIERSSIYTGYKFLWAIRLLLLGKKFPKGHFDLQSWQDITHEVIDIITQEEYMQTLHEIDASAYFQIITIVFNNPSKSYEFLLKGRPNLPHQPIAVSMTHSEVIKRISDYCLKLEEGSEVRLQYLFFIASIASEDQELRDRSFYYKVTQELLSHHLEFMTYNKTLLKRQMSQGRMYRKLSRKGIKAPDQYKHVVLSEESIINLLLKCEPLEKELVDRLVESIQDTNFVSLKLKLYEKQEAYTKCLGLLLDHDSNQKFVTVKMQDRFQWIVQTHYNLEQRLVSRNENTHNRYQFDQFEDAIFEEAPKLVKIDTHKSVGLVSALFGDDLE